jgi:hypothetical protein
MSKSLKIRNQLRKWITSCSTNVYIEAQANYYYYFFFSKKKKMGGTNGDLHPTN